MITVARVLMEDPHFQNPTVLMIVDRNELEEQLFANLHSLGVGRTVVADSKAHLRGLLRDDHRGLIVTTIHKFDDMPADMISRQNVYVLVDEATARPAATWATISSAPCPTPPRSALPARPSTVPPTAAARLRSSAWTTRRGT